MDIVIHIYIILALYIYVLLCDCTIKLFTIYITCASYTIYATRAVVKQYITSRASQFFVRFRSKWPVRRDPSAIDSRWTRRGCVCNERKIMPFITTQTKQCANRIDGLERVSQVVRLTDLPRGRFLYLPRFPGIFSNTTTRRIIPNLIRPKPILTLY